jgi:hypothetical protein
MRAVFRRLNGGRLGGRLVRRQRKLIRSRQGRCIGSSLGPLTLGEHSPNVGKPECKDPQDEQHRRRKDRDGTALASKLSTLGTAPVPSRHVADHAGVNSCRIAASALSVTEDGNNQPTNGTEMGMS